MSQTGGALIFLAAFLFSGDLLYSYPLAKDWALDGSLGLNYRGLGPQGHSDEVEIENQLFLTGAYFSLGGPIVSSIPLHIELTLDQHGSPQLFQMLAAHRKSKRWNFQMGKFLIPYGRYNQLYRPDMHLTATHPMFYADPRNLDVVARINSPRPIFSVGYTDIGAMATYLPPWKRTYLPDKIHAYVVNGLGESLERGRSFPNPQFFVIPEPSPNGVDIDWAHERSDFRDNNDSKTLGGRMEFDFGDFDIPVPLAEGKKHIRGAAMGLSGMAGRYDIEDSLDYSRVGADLVFQSGDLAFASEFNYSYTEFRSPFLTDISTGSTFVTEDLPMGRERQVGYYLQGSFPIKLPEGLRPPGRLTGVVAFNWAQRRAPEVALSSGPVFVNGEQFAQVTGFTSTGPITTKTFKQTYAFHYAASENFIVKLEYSRWDFSTRARHLYQGILSLVFHF